MRISGNRFFRPRLMHDGACCYFVSFLLFPVVVLRDSVQWKWRIIGPTVSDVDLVSLTTVSPFSPPTHRRTEGQGNQEQEERLKSLDQI